MKEQFILQMQNITKTFPGVQALSNVNLEINPGEIHSLVGENGAGKSTLMKILSGVYPYGNYEGQIIIKGEEQKFNTINDSINAKLVTIYQELALVKYLDIVENVFLGHEIRTKSGGIDYQKEYSITKKILDKIGLYVSPSAKIMQLGVGQQQLVEIAKAIVKNAEIIIFDEPTSALTEEESNNLLKLIKEFKEQGITCIYISHKLEEVFKISDTVSVLRDGKMIGTYPAEELNEGKLISLMVGRDMSHRYPERDHNPGSVLFEVRDWTVGDPEHGGRNKLKNISFSLREGEILGIAGLMGAGRTELAMSIIGSYGNHVAGELYLKGKRIFNRHPKAAIRNHICYLSEDRKGNGLVLGMNIKENISLPNLQSITELFSINENEEIHAAEKYVKELQIKTPSIEQKVKNLSGGNQQKVVVGKWLMASPTVLILDEPTRGIDVGAKYEIYLIMKELVKSGMAIIMISSELPEILGMSDRILVMSEGEITAEFNHGEATSEEIMHNAIGSSRNE